MRNWQIIRDEALALHRQGAVHASATYDDLGFNYIHKAMNESDRDRIILFCDVARPLRGRFATAVNRYISSRVLRETATSNQPLERLGFFNHAVKYAYQVRLVGKAVKRRNRTVNYAVKFAILSGILTLILI